MCGIAGIFRRHGTDESDPSRLIAMTGMIEHRGPDDFGYLFLDSRDGRFQMGQEGFEPWPCDVSLGNRRLSIIDLSPLGRQPMTNEARNIFVVFNGEIFNYVELRSELVSRGHVFRSLTDTEVIVHAYEEWGAGCVGRFNGMWAFAIWDQRKRELFCSRDRFGIKPFYYHLDEHVFLFASEIKGILPAWQGTLRANDGVLSDYLVDGTLCRTRETFFAGVERLEPAHNLIVSSGESRSIRYWDYRTESQSYDDRRPVEAFRELLEDSVRLRLRSDVPAGVALSGGVDSTSILALAARHSGTDKLKAFTAVFPGERYDEREYARMAAQHEGVEHFCIDYQPGSFIHDLTDVIWAMDYPALYAQVLPRWQIMRLASRHVKVLLEGQGADEMLAGYPARYFAPHLMDELGRMKSGGNDVSLSQLVTSAREMHTRYGGFAYQELFRQLAPNVLPMRTLRMWRESNMVYTPEFMSRNAGRKEPPGAKLFEDRLTGMLHYDHASGILPMLLKFGDALSMAFSIESRLPFLDHRLVEFVFRMEPRHKLRGAHSKGVLKEAMAGIIPEEIRARRDKVGFATPTARWIAQCMDSHVRPLLLSQRCKERGIFDAKKMETVLTRQAQGKVRAHAAIFRWLSAELWFRIFIDGEARHGKGRMPSARGIL